MLDWSSVKNILCIRADNMGDLVMSGPALRALKLGLSARITVLTSSMAAGVAQFMPEIDEVITFNLPWVKAGTLNAAAELSDLIAQLNDRSFDAAVIFTVYSQNPLPSAMIAYQAAIPRVLAYCRENPYGLITDWVVDQEPFAYINHQVERDLKLVSSVCTDITDKRLSLTVDDGHWPIICSQLSQINFDIRKPWLILHPGVSEIKRQLPEALWIETALQLIERGHQILITGSSSEKELVNRLCMAIGGGAFDVAGFFLLAQLITLINHAPLLLSVNTGTVHLAAAVHTPVVVLYAQTNPQHTPWMVPNAVIEFPVADELESQNAIIKYVNQTVYAIPAEMPESTDIANAVVRLTRPPAESSRPFREIRSKSRVFGAS